MATTVSGHSPLPDPMTRANAKRAALELLPADQKRLLDRFIYIIGATHT